MKRLAKTLVSLVLGVMCLVLVRPVLAEDAGLYASPPPPDAAFVRVLNADAATEALVSVGGVEFSAPPASLTTYSFVTKGDYEAAIPGGTLPMSLVAQKFYTILLSPSGASTLIEDAAITNPVHAGLYFYNATGAVLDLAAQVNGKQAAVFPAVAPGQAVSREVNAFEVIFLVTRDGATAFELPGIVMVRQQAVSIFAIQNGDAITAFQVVNAVTAP